MYFSYALSMAILKKGWLLAQEEGPIEFKLKQFEEDSYTYMQCDGEFYKLKNPDTVTISLARDTLPTGKLKILMRRSEDMIDIAWA